MDESFLQFLWKFQNFQTSDLLTTNGEKVVVFDAGLHNHDSGPDFEQARIKIGAIEWNGSVEIHLMSSEWHRHQHDQNDAYKNVILHVVWKDDEPLTVAGERIPTLELKDRVDFELLAKYENHMASATSIPCAAQLSDIDKLTYLTMTDRTGVERLQRKADQILHLLKSTDNNWDEVLYRTLVQNFGFATNKKAFQHLTEKTPYAVLKKAAGDQPSLEALLFGQAGFLDGGEDAYQLRLLKEFQFLQKKYRLPTHLKKHEWKFGRMRPANFPSLRIAQLSSLLHCRPRFFTNLIESKTAAEVYTLLSFDLAAYWQSHYDFGKERKLARQSIGEESKRNIVINTLAPILAAYSIFIRDQAFMDQAVALLESIPPEKNRITKEWSALHRNAKNAFESQAQIQLLQAYCKKRKCLSCTVGLKLLHQ